MNKEKLLREIRVEAVDRADLDDISRLILEMQQAPVSRRWIRSSSAAYFNWMYFKNPAGCAKVYCAKHNGRIVSTFALVPKNILVGGEMVRCGKTMDMYTHPDYQGLGLMGRLAQLVFDAARKDNIDIWYVTPSINSYPIFKNKWGYAEYFDMSYFIRVVDYSEITSSKLNSAMLGSLINKLIRKIGNVGYFNFSRLSDYEVAELEEFDDRVNALWEKSLDYDCISLVRDKKYLNWRYVENPDDYTIFSFSRRGELCGLLILKYTIRCGLKVGEIVDFLFSNEDKSILQYMLKFGLMRFEKDKCSFAQICVVSKSNLERQVRKAGFRWRRGRLKLLLSPMVDKSSELCYQSKWILTQGDGNDI